MLMYGPLCGYIYIGMLIEVDPMDMHWYVKEDFETLVDGGMVFGTLMCGFFDVMNILNKLRVLYQ